MRIESVIDKCGESVVGERLLYEESKSDLW